MLEIEKIINSINGEIGEEDYLEPLTILLDSLNNEANLSFLGELAASYQIKNHLQTRANIYEITNLFSLEETSPPLFIMGLPRSGTTFLFNLLSLDSDHRSPLFWEMMYPLPLSAKGSFNEKKTIYLAKLMLLFKETLIPGLDSIHAIEATSPEECLLIKTLSIRSLVYTYMAHIPSYQQFLEQENFLPAFKWHKRFLQCLEMQDKPERWLLKDPCHLQHIPEILKTYPEARFINISRDPVETIPSLCNLTASVRAGFTKNIDKHKIGKQSLDFWSLVMDKYTNDRQSIDPNLIIDVDYEDFIENPVHEVRKIYHHFGLELDTQAESSMLSYDNLSTSKNKKNHKYKPEEFGLDKDLIRKKLKFTL
jgi:hypothetical protein